MLATYKFIFSKKDKLDQAKRSIEKKKDFEIKIYDTANVVELGATNQKMNNEIDRQVVLYEEQYDANQDFKIFSTANEKTGGIQNLKEKMNMADANKSIEESEEEWDTKRKTPAHKPVNFLEVPGVASED